MAWGKVQLIRSLGPPIDFSVNHIHDVNGDNMSCSIALEAQFLNGPLIQNNVVNSDIRITRSIGSNWSGREGFYQAGPIACGRPLGMVRMAGPCGEGVLRLQGCVRWSPIWGTRAWWARHLPGRWPDGGRVSIPSQGGRGDALLRRRPPYLTWPGPTARGRQWRDNVK